MACGERTALWDRNLSFFMRCVMSGVIYEINEIKQRLEPVFRKNDVKSAILFGSYAKGRATV
jgi:hypothetical protein